MNGFSKVIHMHLIDGDLNGKVRCELSNWTGIGYKIPRTKVRECSSELTTKGVYMLFGKDDNNDDMVYIGESENVFVRLKNHLERKEFWNEVVVIVSKDDTLHKGRIKHLEYKLYERAKDARRYKLDNSTVPVCSELSFAELAEIAEFQAYTELLVGGLGFKVFQRITEHESNLPEDDDILLTRTKGIIARGKRTSEGFVVFKDSMASKTITPSLEKNRAIVSLKQQLVDNGILLANGETYIFTDDFLFASPSIAGSVVIGYPANAYHEWKTKDGRNLRDIEA